MKRAQLFQSSSRRAVLLGVALAALVLAGCDNSINWSPTQPPFEPFQPVGDRDLQISGSLTASGGTCLEATVLFDGVELVGARADCSDPGGCGVLELSAATSADAGTHTISFTVLEQSEPVVDYRVEGRVLVTRDGIWLGGVTLQLDPRSVALRQGDSVTYEIDFRD